MLVFIDESGDPGFKVDKGATPIFVTAMVIFENAEAAQEAEAAILKVQRALGIKPEFKFNKSRSKVRDGFFNAVKHCQFTVRAIVVEKRRIYSPHLQTSKDKFYEFFVRQMMAHDHGRLVNAKVVIDGSGDRAFKNNLKTYLRRHVGIDAIKDVRFKDSRRDPLVQLADMCVGAIARSYRTDRKNSARWRDMLAPKIDDVWEFR